MSMFTVDYRVGGLQALLHNKYRWWEDIGFTHNMYAWFGLKKNSGIWGTCALCRILVMAQRPHHLGLPRFAQLYRWQMDWFEVKVY